MSRGPGRRVRALLDAAAVSDELLRAADHEADLLAHPYISIEHLELGRLRMAGRTAEYEALRQQIGPGVPRRRWWRPRGLASALRRRAASRPGRRNVPHSARSATRNDDQLAAFPGCHQAEATRRSGP